MDSSDHVESELVDDERDKEASLQRQIDEEIERELALAAQLQAIDLTPAVEKHADPIAMSGDTMATDSSRQAEEAARQQAEEAARQQAEEAARRQAEEAARQQAEEAARRQAEEAARRQAEEAARRQAEEAARRQAEEAARQQAEEAARRQAEEAARQEAEKKAADEALAIEREVQRRLAEERRQRDEALAIEREIARRVAEQQAKEEEERQRAAHAEAERQLREAEAQQARIDSAVAERLRKVKEEADVRRRQQEAEAEIERRVAEALAKQAELDRLEKERKEEERKKQEAEAEIERRISAAAEARIQAALAAAGVASVVPTQGSEIKVEAEQRRPVASTRGVDVKSSDVDVNTHTSDESDPDDDEVTATNEEDAASTDEEEGDASTADSHAPRSRTQVIEALSTDLLRNKNGILQPEGASTVIASPDSRSAWTLAAAPDFHTFEATLAKVKEVGEVSLPDMHQERVTITRYSTQREAGRCLVPNDPSHVALTQGKQLTHASLQLGFFTAQQTLVSYATHTKSSKIQVAEREMKPCGTVKTSLSAAHFHFEADILKDTTITAEADDEEDYPFNHVDEVIARADEVEIDPRASVVNATSTFAYGDPIQLYERARGRRLEPPKSSAAVSSAATGGPAPPVAMTTVSGPSTGRLWVQDIETKKPTAAVPMFNGGILLKFDIQKVISQVDALHGEGTDPLFLSAAVYSVPTSGQAVCVTDTFYFDSHAFTFLPHRRPEHTSRTFIAFIPNEFRSSPMHLCIRASRLATEEQDNYIDLYCRPDRYKQHHVVPMKQETQQLAMQSEIMEEIGWATIALNEGNAKLVTGVQQVDKLLRGSKPVGETEMIKLINDAKLRGGLKSFAVQIEVNVTDITSYEFSFRHPNPIQPPEENESFVEYLNPDVPGATKQVARLVPCSLPILNSGHFHAYHNVIYFRLQLLRFINTTAVKFSTSMYSNFVVQVALKGDDDSLAEEGVNAIYTKWLGEGLLQRSGFSSSFHCAKEFESADEFKMQLPLHLTEKHHIFITVYAITFKKLPPGTKDTPAPPRLVKIGHAAVPILSKEHGCLALKDTFDIQVVAAEHAALACPGYLEKFSSVPASNQFNNGTFAIKAGLLGRSSVYASNTIVSDVFRKLPASLSQVVRDDGVLSTSGLLTNLTEEAAKDEVHSVPLNRIAELPLPEVMAFYPLLTSYTLSVVCSPSATVSLAVRTHALKVLIEFTSRAHTYELSTKSFANRRSNSKPSTPAPASQTGCIRTCSVNILYHYLSNDLLYRCTSILSNGASAASKNSKCFRMYAGIAEVLTLFLESTTGNASIGSKGDVQQLLVKISDLSWFFLDGILKSLYLAQQQLVNRIDQSSLFAILQRLVREFLSKISPIGGVIIIQRLAIFIRNLAFVCDRGYVLELMELALSILQSQAIPANVLTAARIFAEDEDVVTLLLPHASNRAPQYLTALLIEFVGPHLVHQVRDVRVTGAAVFYQLLCRLSNSRRVSSDALSGVATQLLALLGYLSDNWPLYRQLTDPKQQQQSSPLAASAIADKRTLLASALWIIFYAPPSEFRGWMKSLEPKALAGFMQLLADAQTAFRFQHGKDKFLPDQAKLPADVAETIALWDARYSTFVGMTACRVISDMLHDLRETLATVGQEKSSPAVFPFFLLVESVLSFSHSTAVLQASAAVLHQVVVELMPEIISRRGRMSSGVVLLAIRIMSGTCLHPRTIAARSFYAIARFYYELCGSTSKLKHHTANALVSIAESKVRDLRLAGRFVERHLNDLVRQLQQPDGGSRDVPLPEDSRLRYVEEGAGSSGDAAMKYPYTVKPLFVGFETKLVFPAHVLAESSASNASRPFADDFAGMCSVMLSLFRDVLRLQTDDSMRFKETKGIALFDVVRNFLRQNTLKEVLKWLSRLHQLHRSNNDFAEAGLVLVFTAALGFRITDAFYSIKGGAACKGARMPFETLTHVMWHDYVRILPEVSSFIPIENVYEMARDLSVLPDDPAFTIEGQIKLMKEASEFLDKNGYYELSLGTVGVVGKYLQAKGDFKGCAVVHQAMHTWSNAVATNAGKRQNYRYYLLWVRMEREVSSNEASWLRRLRKRRAHSDSDDEDESTKVGASASATVADYLPTPIKLIYKQPSGASLASFSAAAKEFVATVFTNASLVVMTDEMVGTQPPASLPTFRDDAKLTKAIKTQLKQPNRCLVTVVEVNPCIADGGASSIDRSAAVSRFEHVNRVGGSIVTVAAKNGAPLLRSQHVSTNFPKSHFDVMKQQLSVNVHFTTRSFPSTTVCIPVERSEEELLDCYQTAIETMNAELDALDESAAGGAGALTSILRCLTPMDIVPPGTYYKEVVAAMNHNDEVMTVVRDVVRTCRERLSKAEEDGTAVQKSPESYALILKGLADVQCALIDYPPPEAAPAAPVTPLLQPTSQSEESTTLTPFKGDAEPVGATN